MFTVNANTKLSAINQNIDIMFDVFVAYHASSNYSDMTITEALEITKKDQHSPLSAFMTYVYNQALLPTPELKISKKLAPVFETSFTPKHTFQACDFTPNSNITELLHICKDSVLLSQFLSSEDLTNLEELNQAVSNSAYRKTPYSELVQDTAPDFFNLLPITEALLKAFMLIRGQPLSANVQHRVDLVLDVLMHHQKAAQAADPNLYANLQGRFKDRYSITNNQPTKTQGTVENILAPYFADTQFAALLHRSVGNSALFTAISAITALITADVDLDNPGDIDFSIIDSALHAYNEATDYCNTHGETRYDKTMPVEDALTLLMTPRPIDETLIEKLASATRMSSKMLTNIAEMSAIERTRKFRKHAAEIAEYFNKESAAVRGNFKYSNSPSVQHTTTIRFMRACAKAKISTLNYTIKTSRLDRLGFFSFTDKLIEALATYAKALEFNCPDDVLDSPLYNWSAADILIEYARLG